MIAWLNDLAVALTPTTYQLDVAAGTVSLLNAALLAAIHSLTSPKAGHWMPAPWWLRLLIFPPMLLCAYRGAEFIHMRGDTEAVSHATLAAVGAGLAFAGLFSGALAFILSMTYPPRTWDRLKGLASLLNCRRDRREAILPGMVSAAAVAGLEIDNPRSQAIPPRAVPAEWVPPEVVH